MLYTYIIAVYIAVYLEYILLYIFILCYHYYFTIE